VSAQQASEPAASGRAARLSVAPAPGPGARRAVRSTLTSARFDPLLPFESWSALGAKLGGYSNATAWWLGDWLAFGQMKYGRRYKEAIAATGLEYQTLRNYAAVARRFDPARRRDDLTFHHHAEVCALSDELQERWLALAAANRWSKAELRRRVSRSSRALQPAPAPGTRVTISVDPYNARRWHEAAARCGCDLNSWLVQALDAAALQALAAPRAVSARAGPAAGIGAVPTPLR